MVGGICGFKFSSPTSRNRIYQPIICGKGNMQPQFLLEFLEGKKGAINIKQVLQAYDSTLVPLFEENCVLVY